MRRSITLRRRSGLSSRFSGALEEQDAPLFLFLQQDCDALADFS
jgi:hypothetical protein